MAWRGVAVDMTEGPRGIHHLLCLMMPVRAFAKPRPKQKLRATITVQCPTRHGRLDRWIDRSIDGALMSNVTPGSITSLSSQDVTVCVCVGGWLCDVL